MSGGRDALRRLGAPEAGELRRALLIAGGATGAVLIHPTLAMAQAINLDLGSGGGLTDRVVQLVALLTVLSLAPSIVMMTTSFVRIVVVLSLLRQAMGLQQSPPNSVIVSLALFLSAIVMGPTFTQSYNAGIRPLLNHTMELPAAFQASAEPVKAFMLSQVDRDDLGLFIRMSRIPRPASAQATPLTVVTPAYMISELKRAFQIGFLLFIPFLVIDLVVASVLMSMGMMMLPPRHRQPSVQADLLRSGERLAARLRQPCRKFPPRGWRLRARATVSPAAKLLPHWQGRIRLADRQDWEGP